MLTPAEVQRLLRTHGLAPRRAFGQNFVVDQNTIRKVVRDAGVEPGALVYEVGPGLGSLTLGLLEAGARVVAVEIDAGMVRALTEVLDEHPRAQIVHADALAVDYEALLDGGPALMVANLPYNVATPIVMRALQAGGFSELFVMVQKEVGRRWAARPGDKLYAAISVKLAALADVSVVAPVSRNAFVPVPNVDSVTVRLHPRTWELPVDMAPLFAVVEAGFRQRRKRLRNALSAAVCGSPQAVEAALERAGLPAGARAEELGLDAWVDLARALATGPADPPG